MAKQPKYRPYSLEDFANDDLAGSIVNYGREPVEDRAPEPAEPEQGDFTRGVSNYIPQMKEMGNSIETLAGVAAKKVGLDTVGDYMIESGLKGLSEAKKQVKSKDTDSFSNAWDKGIGTVVTDWLPYQMGQTVGNVGEGLAAMGAGAAIGAAASGPAAPIGAAGGAAGGLVGGIMFKSLLKKGVIDAAKELAEKEGEQVARNYLKKQALTLAGTNAAMASQAVYHGFGETGGRVLEEAQANGIPLDQIDLGRYAGSAAGHAALEFIGDKILMGGVFGEQAYKAAGKGIVPFAKTVGGNVLKTGAKEMPVEMGQTGLERYAAGLDLTSKDAQREYVDSAAAAGAMGVAGAPGGVRAYLAPDPLATQLNEQKAKGGPLSGAVLAAKPELKIEPEPVDPITQAGQQWQAIAPQDDLARQQRIARAAQGATFDGLPAGEAEALPDPVSPEFIDGMPNGAVNAYAPGNSIGAGLPADQPAAGLGAGPGPVVRPGADAPGPAAEDLVPAAELPDGALERAVAPIAGDAINKTWTEFHPASGTLNIPRKEMPQIKSEHRGAMTNFLAARGVTGAAETVEASSLKPTQREFSPAKVKQALAFQGSDRPVLVSSDGFILDGHHQWLAKAEQEAPVKITRLSAPIADLLVAMKEFPSAGMTKDAEPFSQPQGKTDVTQAAQAVQTEEKGQEAPSGQLKLVLAPQNVAAEPASASNPGNALVRLRRAQVQRMAQAGFTRLETRGGQTLMVNPVRNEAMVVTGGPVAVTLAQQAVAALPQARDTGALGAQDGRVSGAAAAAARGGANTRSGAGDRGVAGVDQDLYGDLRDAAPGSLHERGRALQNPQADADAVAALSAAIGYQIPLADPASPVTQALDQLLDVMAGLTGVRGIAISDPSKQADDGLAMPGLGRFFVNTQGAQMHAGRTIAHEFKHLTEKNPGLKALYDRMWDLVPQAARAAYFSKYLFKNQDIAQASPKQLQTLKDEMMADFMGQRFNDRQWLESLAKQKPGLFAQFIKEWIPLLDQLITELKGLIKPTKALAQKNIDTLMKGYVKELEAMKALAVAVAVAWAENNSGLAAKSNINTVTQYAKRQGGLMSSARPSLQDELQAELDAELNGVTADPDALAADIQDRGIMAEAAFPPIAWREAKGSMGTQYVADIEGLRANGRTERLEMNEDAQSSLWDLGFPGTWVGPAMGERDGFASKKAVQAFAQRQAAARGLKAQGFDLASTLDKQQQYNLLDAWRTMERVPAEGSSNGAHKYAGIQAVSQSLKDIAVDMGITQDYELTVTRDLQDRDTTSFNLVFRHKVSGAEFGARLDQHQAEGKRFLTANTLEMGKGGLGAAFYQLAAEYAARRNMPLRPESSLSGINSYRRTEQQLSAALRTGKSNVMVPHPVQRVYGFEDGASRKESHDANLVRLILAGLRNAKELVKDFAKLRYVPETGEFTDTKGKSKEAAVQKLLATPDARAFGLGRTTLARALLTQQVLDGAKAPAGFKEPVLYSARDTAAAEYQAVIDQYQNTDAWMKAPNGQPTKLTERQWVQVRTPSFAAWFGPWQEYGIGTEKGTVWNDDESKVSKAIDENGEPLVVYHGTDKGGFMAFKQPGGDRRGDLGVFTTPNRAMASSYIRRGREQDLTPPTEDELLKELGIEVLTYQGRTSSKDTEDRALYGYTTPDGSEVDGFLTKEEAVKSAIDDYGDVEFDTKAGIYAVFMNIRNPNEDDFEGALWSGSREHLWQVVDADGETRESGGKIYMEEDEAKALAKSIAEPDDEYEGADFLQPASDHWNDTDGVVREAIRAKNDGAIIRNVIDDGGGYSAYDNEPSDVFVALRPEQLKSADFNTGEFGLSRDLRYSQRDISDINPKVLAATPEVAKLAAYLTPVEKSKLRVDTAQKMLDLHKALPSADEMAVVAYAGKAKRFWYRNSLSAIAHVFGADGWRFTGLLAAMSPQCSVETNLLNALSTWKNWVAAGRPTSKEEIVAVMGRSVQGNKGEDSVLGAWINNAVSALTAKDFADLVLSGPKVDSFMRNLLGHYYEVTNDVWIANYTLMDQKIFSGSKNKAGTEPGKGPGYLAMNAQTRKAAKKLGWQPAEVQETVWSWAMSMLETMDKQGETRGSKELLADGAMTDELINRTPDFRSLFHLPVYANILEQAGYHDALADLVAPHTVEDHGPMPFEQKKMDKLLHQAGLRLEFLQRQRRTNVQLSWEARPGESTGILPGIHAAPIELQQQYMADIYAAIESSGFYDKTGLSLRATLFGPGAWQGKVLPGAQSMTRPGIVADNKGGLMVDPESRAKINAAASVLGMVLNQEGVYWHYPIYTDKVENANGIEINFGRSLTNDEMSQLYGAIITKAGHTDWAPANTPTGVRVLNFNDNNHKNFHKVVLSALPLFGKKLTSPLTANTKMFMSDGDALENNWKEKPNAEDYQSRLSQAGRSDLLGWIVDVLQPAIDQVNRRYSTEHNWGAPTRGEIQRSAREGGPGNRRRPSDAAAVQFSDRDRAGWQPGSGAEDSQSTAQRSDQTGRGLGQDQGSAQELTPLPGAPNVPGFYGPDPRLVAVAHKYAADNGITLKRQSEYVQIDEARAKRIAAAYEAMPHAPNDPKVKAAFDNLIQQTTAQYRALADAGYRFWFMDMAREDNQQYAASPWNAMRDIRANKTMGVFPTREGYGSGDTDLDVADNPMLADTGIQWPVGDLNGAMQPVLANDLFRAVHDAFGHGLEGAGFRAQGEENAWQAHARLFTGSAIGAITSETRGQNSWLNYGPKGEANRTAKVEDTVFADQKTGLMPEWTWTEGVASDKPKGAMVRAAIHFGQRAGLSQLSGLSNGTGIRGAEDQRLKEATDPRIKRRVYFYSPVTGGIPQPEAGLGGNVYQADLDKLYDPSTATRPLSGSGNAFESSVLDAGYDGYLDPTSGVIVMLGQDVPVKHIGSLSDFKLIPRVAKQVKLKTQTTVSGNELSRKPEPAEMMALIKNKAAIAKAAPSFRFEYGFVKVGKEHAEAFDRAMAGLDSSFRLAEQGATLVAPEGLQNGKKVGDKTLAQRVEVMRELLACLA